MVTKEVERTGGRHNLTIRHRPVEPEIGSCKGQPGGIPPIGIKEISIKN